MNVLNSPYIVGGRNSENGLKGGREFSMGHFNEEDNFPAKAPQRSITHDDSKILHNPDKGDYPEMDHDSAPITVKNLNISPRHQVCPESVVDTVRALDVAIREDFKDVQAKDAGLKCLGKFGVQEENFANCDTYRSQFVVSGTRMAVSSLLEVTDQLMIGTHGVIVDETLRPSYFGQYEEKEEFTVVKRLGKGGFGEVDLCQHKSGKKYVTKRIFGKFKEKEVQVLMALSHENITSFMGYIKRNGTHEILLQYGGVSLKTFVETEKNWRSVWNVQMVMNLAVQGFSALRYMHSFGILHLDVKPENVCIDYESESGPILRLTDFGTSKTPEQAITHDGWTPEYMSPEACQSILVSQNPELGKIFKQYDLTGKSDVFAFGLTLYFMFQGSHAVLDIWRKQITPETFSAVRPNFIVVLAQYPNYICETVVQTERPGNVNVLLSQVLVGDPSQRMTAEDAGHFIQRELLREEVEIPTILQLDSPGSRSVDMSDDAMTSQTTFDPVPSADISLRGSRPSGGGKNIKNHLRQKLLRRKSAGPYQRQESHQLTCRPERSEVAEASDHDMSLPVFAALLDD